MTLSSGVRVCGNGFGGGLCARPVTCVPMGPWGRNVKECPVHLNSIHQRSFKIGKTRRGVKRREDEVFDNDLLQSMWRVLPPMLSLCDSVSDRVREMSGNLQCW